MNNEKLVSAHPVEPAMRTQILECLNRLEAEHDVKVLFACESGSRGWGFASPDSDYDVRFIYVNRLPWYLTVEQHRDVIEQPISGDLDVNGWDLRKTLQLLRQSNPTLLEWLRSPIVYREHAERQRACACWRPRASHWCAAITTTCRWRRRTFVSTCVARPCATRSTCTCCGRCWQRDGFVLAAGCRPCDSRSWRSHASRRFSARRDQPLARSEDGRRRGSHESALEWAARLHRERAGGRGRANRCRNVMRGRRWAGCVSGRDRVDTRTRTKQMRER